MSQRALIGDRARWILAMVRTGLSIAIFALSMSASAQFVWPKPSEHEHEPNVYKEDPFIVAYRKRFFSVFSGDYATFDKAYGEIEAMVHKNPRDARALVWLGNGETIRAGTMAMTGHKGEARKLLDTSRATLDHAVALRPDDPNIYMMRVATLYVQGQYFPDSWIPRSNWEHIRDDCLRFIRYIGPQRMPKASVHVRGEAYGELGTAYLRLKDYQNARNAFSELILLDPGTAYAERARKELAAMPQ